MTIFFMWPHLWAIAMVSAVAAGALRRGKGLRAGLLFAGGIFLLYVLLQNGVAPPHGRGPFRYVVLFLVCVLPLAASGAAGDALARRTELSPPARIAISVVARVIVLAAMPFLSVGLSCALGGICP